MLTKSSPVSSDREEAVKIMEQTLSLTEEEKDDINMTSHSDDKYPTNELFAMQPLCKSTRDLGFGDGISSRERLSIG